MKAVLGVLAAWFALSVADASAQGVDLTGRYRCVEYCRGGLVGQAAFATQNGWDLNLVNEAGELSRAWIERVGRIWVPGWNEGAVYSPDGMVIQFDRGTVWQRDLGAVELAPPSPRSRGQKAAKREAPPPRAAVAAERAALARSAFDGSWSVMISTESGPCDPQYRFGVQIVDGNVVYEGGLPANVQGQVAPNGGVWVSVSGAGQQASGRGRLSGNFGTGSWRGQGAGGSCAGTWQAARRG